MKVPDIGKILKGQKVIVTGGSSGIGKACAVEMGRAGADVVVNYCSNSKGAAEAVEKIKAFGSKAYTHKADVSNEHEVKSMFDKMIEDFGTIDILVNNSGIQIDAPIGEMILEQWKRVLDVNLTGQFLCAKEAIKEFRRRGINKDVSCSAGKIICMSSVHEVIPWAGHVNYAASKGGIMLMCKSMAQELAPEKIRVFSIGPGAIRTPINKPAWETKEAYEDLKKLIPYKRIGEPEEIGKACAWLASDHADYITGTTIMIDGGMTLYPGFEEGG